MVPVIKTIVFLLTFIVYTQSFSWDEYYGIDEIYTWLRHIAAENPDYVELLEIGVSYEGRPLLGLRLSSDLSDTNRQIVMVESGIHAREWEAPASTTYFIHQLLYSWNEDISALKDAVEWRIFPCVNPDGYQYTFDEERFWRKSRAPSNNNGCRGADMNRNWAHNFGEESASDDPCSYLFWPGSEPFSEIETRTLSEYITSISSRLVGYVAVHSLEKIIYVPYGDSEVKIPDYDSMVQIGTVMLEYAKTVNGTVYDPPSSAALVSYPASGMSVDWVYEQFSTPMAFLIELRGFSFPRSYIQMQAEEYTQMMLGMITEAKNMGIVSN